MFTEDSLPDLQWQKLHQGNEKMCRPVHPAEFAQSLVLVRCFLKGVPDVEATDKLSKLVARGIYIKIQAERNSSKTLISKNSPVSPQNNKSR